MKIRVLISLDFKTLCLLMEAFVYLGVARLLLRKPFYKVAPTIGLPMSETPREDDAEIKPELNRISKAVKITSRYTFWQSQCFVKAIAGMKMLERRGISSTLYLGTARDESGKMIAHAWLRSGSCYVTGKEGMDRFTVVSCFAKLIKHG